jgi:pimeloyl-ACP methyl ester carboxylesterase
MRWYDAHLQQLAVPIESRIVPTPVGSTHVLMAGPVHAPPVILLHGMNMNALAMDTALVTLSAHYRVYALDIIGMAGRSAERRLPRQGSAYPHWLAAVMNQLALPHARFVGVSFGGWLLLKLGALAPERITHGVLLAAGGLTPFTLRGQVVAGHAALRYMWQPTARNLLRAVQPFYAPGQRPEPRFLQLMGLAYQHVTLDIDRTGLPPLQASDLARVHAPFMVRYGAHDIFFDGARALQQARRVLPNVQDAALVANEGHAMSRQAETAMYERISTFLGRS